jgi:predicted DNA-binding protein (UPF0251 family)
MKPKGRPKKRRIVKVEPQIVQFSPRGRPGRPDEIDLAVEELEALRMADLEAIDQRAAARKMKISQQTFSRIIRRARKLTAEALVKGKILRIRGGHYTIDSHHDFSIKETAEKPKESLKNQQNQKEFNFV